MFEGFDPSGRGGGAAVVGRGSGVGGGGGGNVCSVLYPLLLSKLYTDVSGYNVTTKGKA